MKEKISETVFDSIDELLAGRIIAHAKGLEEPETAPPAPEAATDMASSESDIPDACPGTNAPPPMYSATNGYECKPTCSRGLTRLVIAAGAILLIIIGIGLPKHHKKRSRWF